MAGNKNLNSAARAKKDKFYTQLEDIENELWHYRDFFIGKTVLCNCDDPFESNFFKYFAAKFNDLELKKLVTVSYIGSPIAGGEVPLGETDKFAYMTEVTELKDWNGDGRESLDDVEYAIRHNIYNVRKLIGTGDFRSSESVAALREADVVVTNPPFSVFREYVAQLIEYDKKFIILGNKNALTYKEIFPLIMQNKLWVGFMPMSREIYFDVPQSYIDEGLDAGKDRSIVIHDGRHMARSQSIWFTNFDISKFREDIPLYKKYSPDLYPRYDNYDAIEVGKTAEIPEDYFGVMGVPITFLDKYNPAQFEIIGMAKRGAGDPALKTKVYTAADYPNYSDLNAGPVLIVNGKPKNTYPRILIRRRQHDDKRNGTHFATTA